ncbi:MAG: endonuclease/exonuclease/phosphatase family protein, partial [Flammeovirgaceae bacterium]
RVLNEIEKLNADVLCLQECDHDLFLEFYKVNLEEMGYTTVYKIATTNRIVTNVIAYKRDLFRQENWELLDLNEGLQTQDESFIKHKECLIITLRHLTSGKQIVVANTHLFWNPDFEYVKYGQISKILTHIESKYNKLPLILCGDLNSTPTSNVIRYVYGQNPVFSSNIRGDPIKNKHFMELFYKENLHKMNIRSAYDVY